jgi:hypothetical protein
VYHYLSRGAVATSFKEVWCTRVPPKIKVFLWQLIRGLFIRGLLISYEQVSKRHELSNDGCYLCGEIEDSNHIFFTCPIVRFVWAGVRELLRCDWNPAGARDFLIIAQNLSGSLRRVVWFMFVVQCWTLWLIRNKLTTEGKSINSHAHTFFQISLHMRSWRVLVKPKNMALLRC